jgi:shikimate kinase
MGTEERAEIRSHKTIILIGMMGVGKSTVGQELAERLQLPFTDLDIRMSELDLFQRSAPRILREDGENVFRALEHRALETWLNKTAQTGGVLATGGGVVTKATSRETLIESQSLIIWLDARADTIMVRIQNDTDNVRPLLDGLSGPEVLGTIQALIDQRAPLYKEISNTVIDCDKMNPQTCINQILASMEQ